MIEMENPLLGEPRDTMLFAKWTVQRVELERGYWTNMLNPATPVTMIEGYHEGMFIIDTLLSKAPERMRRWGLEAQTKDSLKMLGNVLREIQTDSIIRPEKERVKEWVKNSDGGVKRMSGAMGDVA